MMSLMMNNTVAGIDGTHTDLSAQYGCRAFLTTVTFPVKGAMIRARRFYRADMPTTGKIELYTLEPRSEYAAHLVDGNGARVTPMATNVASYHYATEDFLRYVNTENPCNTDRLAQRFIGVAECIGHSDAAERAALLELE